MKLILATVFVIIFGIFAHVKLSQAKELDKQAADACIKELSALTPDEIKRINDNQIMSKGQPNASNNLQCYLLCYYKKIGIMEANDKRNPAVLIEYMGHIVKDKSKVPEMLQKCASTKSTNPCESVYNFEKCVFDQNN